MLKEDLWLSKYFDGGAFYYHHPYKINTFPKGFIFTKLFVDNLSDFDLLMEQDFKLVEVAVQYEQSNILLNKSNHDFDISFIGNEQDSISIIEIAKDAFKLSRFYQDNKIQNSVASKIKTDWVANYFRGNRGNNMIVAKKNDAIIGFMLLINNTIDLIAVSLENTRKGVASLLIQFANKHIGLLRAGTQLINKSSIALYENTGFKLKQAYFVLHKHVK